MPLDSRVRMRPPLTAELNLPPPFRAIALREAGDAFAHAVKIAAAEGAGTLVHVGRFDLAEFALVLEPEEPLRRARRALYAGLVAVAAALAAHAPPEQAIEIAWPDAVRVGGRLVGGARLGVPTGAAETKTPPWLVLAAAVRAAAPGAAEPARHRGTTALDLEGFDVDPARLIESFCRHFMVAVDAWQQHGFAEVAADYLSRLAPDEGAHRDLDRNGDLLVRRDAKTERRSLRAALAEPSWLDPASGGPRW